MAVQYKAQKKARTGGTGSGSLNTGARGPTKTTLTGYIIAAIVLFQATGDPVPGNQLPLTGAPRTSEPKIELVANWNTNAETRKMIKNLVYGFFIIKVLFSESTL